MTRQTRLELTWIGKENRPKLEPRILIEDQDKSHHAPFRVSDKDVFDNRLIFGKTQKTQDGDPIARMAGPIFEPFGLLFSHQASGTSFA